MVATLPYQLNAGELIGNTFRIFFRNLVPFTLLSGVLMVPWVVIVVSARDFAREPGLAVLAMVMQILLGLALTGAVTYGVVQQMLGKPAPIGESIAAGTRALPRVLLTGTVATLICAVSLLGLLVGAVIAYVILFVAVPAAVAEQTGVVASLKRSVELTDGSRWPIFGALLVVSVTSGIANAIVNVPAMLLLGVEASLWVQIVTAIVLAPLGAVLGAVCYVLLRRGKEHVDVRQLAAVFE